MKSMRALLVVGFLALAAVNSLAQVEFKLTTHVAFPFVVADQTVPAGSSTFIINSGKQRLTIAGPGTRISVSGGHLVFTDGREAALTKKKNELHFVRYGDEHFLSALWVNNQGMSLAKSKRQTALEKDGKAGRELTLVVK